MKLRRVKVSEVNLETRKIITEDESVIYDAQMATFIRKNDLRILKFE